MSVMMIAPPPVQEYKLVWAETLARELERAGGTPFATQPLSSEELESLAPVQDPSGLWFRFQTGGMLQGEQALAFTPVDAIRLAQILLGEPPNDSAPFTPEHRSALSQLFRKLAEVAGVNLAKKLGSDTRLVFSGEDAPSWTPAAQASFRLSKGATSAVMVRLQLSAELLDSLQSASPHAPRPARHDTVPVISPTPIASDGNLSLLMDVELEVTLRFGQRQVLLRDVLELAPGSVIELDQRIEDPVDLLVGKKVVARGEVVIVEGNYGIRVTEISSARERIESLRKSA